MKFRVRLDAIVSASDVHDAMEQMLCIAEELEDRVVTTAPNWQYAATHADESVHCTVTKVGAGK